MKDKGLNLAIRNTSIPMMKLSSDKTSKGVVINLFPGGNGTKSFVSVWFSACEMSDIYLTNFKVEWIQLEDPCTKQNGCQLSQQKRDCENREIIKIVK